MLPENFKPQGLYPYNPSAVLDKQRTKEKEVDEWEEVEDVLIYCSKPGKESLVSVEKSTPATA